MTKENLDAVYPNPLATEPLISILGEVSGPAVNRLLTATKTEIAAIYSHYLSLGIRPDQQLTQSTLNVYIYSGAEYRRMGQGANTWLFNYLLGMSTETGIIINSDVLKQMPNEYPVLINHEIRHAYIALLLGEDVFASSFPLKEGTAGLSLNSTARLSQILKRGNDELTLPMTISFWDRQLDENETNRRVYIDNPWYLTMFSFFHDYVGVAQRGMNRLFEVYKHMPSYNNNLSLAWKKTQRGEATLENLQTSWLQKYGFDEFKIKK